jgi:RNA recognition motif-containing protein
VLKLYVANFPFDTTAQDLLGIFDEWAGRNAYIVTGADGRPKGFGFIDIDEVVAELAINKLDGSYYGGRRLHVSVARRQPRERTNFKQLLPRGVEKSSPARS